MNLGAGQLDRPIWLQLRTETRDPATNAPLFTWADSVQVFARIKESPTDAAGNFAGEGGVEAYARPTRIFINYRELDKEATRVRWGSRLLRIIGTAELGRRWRLELACEEWSTHV